MTNKNYYIIANSDLADRFGGMNILHWAGGPNAGQSQWFGEALTDEQVLVLKSQQDVTHCVETKEQYS